MTLMYLLRASGRGSAMGLRAIYSRRVFRTVADAEAYKPEFRAKVTDASGAFIDSFEDDENLKISVVELELAE